jgi:TRAP-type C4-dicarboxylate transport system substrate-binding protein
VINKDVWTKMPEADRKLIEIVSEQVTLECWMRVGAEDVKAFDFYKTQGVEMIELDDEVQFAARKLGLDWADRTAKSGKFKYFAEVHQSQVDFDKAWRNADSWRKVKVRPV